MSVRRSLIHACHDTGTAWSGNGRCGKYINITDPLFCQIIQIGCPHVFLTIATQVKSKILSYDPENVGTFFRDGRLREYIGFSFFSLAGNQSDTQKT